MKAELKAELKAESERETAEKANVAVTQAANNLLKEASDAYMVAVNAWAEGGCVGPMPQFAFNLTAQAPNAYSGGGENSPVLQAHHSSPSVSCGGGTARASPRAELDALTVSVTHAQQINCTHPSL